MKRRVVAMVVALLLALLGGGLVISYVHGADARAVTAQHPVTAYVAKQLVPAGTTLADARSRGLIVATKIARSGRPTGALSDVTASAERVATTDIQPGEFVMAARFGTAPAGQSAITVPAKKVAISVQLTAPARVANFITPGSHIVVYATHGIKMLATDQKAKTFNELDVNGTNVLFPDVEVIAFGGTPLQKPSNSPSTTKGNGTGSTNDDAAYLVTVAVTPTQSVRLVHALKGYTLYAGLLGADTKVDPNGQTNDMTIFGGKSAVQGSQ